MNRESHKIYENQGYKGKKCDYYHFSGHTRENCYKFIGYPIDWKQRKTTVIIMKVQEDTIIKSMEERMDIETNMQVKSIRNIHRTILLMQVKLL